MSPFRRLAGGVVVAAVVVLATALPASAHDSLVHSTPAADERLATAPESVTLTFSGDLLVLGDSTQGAVVLIVDADGRDWASGELEVAGNTVTAAVEPGMPDAGYQVRWQVVSEDGHPISGIVPFTIGDGQPLAADAATGAPTDADAPPYVPEEAARTADETDGGTRVLLVGAGGAALAAIAFVLYRILRRPRTAPAAPDDGDAAEEL